MSYLVLARKFRPQTFRSIVGQDHITIALANSILRNRVPHALLFTGSRGVGKTTGARVFAKALNCSGRALPTKKDIEEKSEEELRDLVEPCCKCSNCKEIASSSSLAVWEVDGASNNSVDNIRDLIDSLYTLPPDGSRYKIYIIDEVHMLSTAAFNALLKSLEEPPPNTVFIFATTEPQKIPDTVISRCQRHDCRRLSIKQITNRLKEILEAENVKIEPSILDLIARKSKGGMRDAQSMLDRLISFSSSSPSMEQAQQIFGVIDSSFFFDLTKAIFSKDTSSCLDLLTKAFSYSLDIKTFVSDFISHFRNLLLLKALKEEKRTPSLLKSLDIYENDLAFYNDILADVNFIDVKRLFSIAEEVSNKALSTEFSKYVIEAGVLNMVTLESLKPIGEIINELRSISSSFSENQKKNPKILKNTKEARNSANDISKKILKETLNASPSSKEEETRISFNPSWQEFVNFIKSVRSSHVLSATLRRASVLRFDLGVLELEALKFDRDLLNDSSMLDELKESLYAYSKKEKWIISIKEQDSKEVKKSYIEGSLANKEVKKNREYLQKRKEEAINSKSVKMVLDVFSGAKVDKVRLVKKT